MNELFENNKGLAIKIARDYIHVIKNTSVMDYEDLKQICLIGLYKASKKYCENKGCKFTTFAGTVIKNEIKMECRKIKKDYNNTVYLEDTEAACYDIKEEADNILNVGFYKSKLDKLESEIFDLLLKEYSVKSIGEILNIKKAKIYYLKKKIKNKLKIYIERK